MLRIKGLLTAIICTIFLSQTGTAEAAILKRENLEKTGIVYWDKRSNEKLAALTFDDGPHPKYTKQILNILKDESVKATFFPIGSKLAKYSGIAERIALEGHEIGNHTMNHVYLYHTKKEEMKLEILQAEEQIRALQPLGPKYFRPPGGILDWQAFHIAAKEGYKIIMWSWNQDPEDWSAPGSQVIASRVIKNIQNGDIILLHDGGGNRKQTVSALKMIIPALKKKGYRFVTVSEMLNAK
ncbi:polysaccharide deacetylase family protein [Metabacillus sp. GX 13764]|uniref:polysaccharide deacetylase family protein n=1 Tax=Metabacillus kandeliae TaxID=2900151 RepID=UPI001E2E3C83|nr:polysaccharide deacetylase family protein [Metabacillus kandeliae]MCD7035540.1 polysaccharide deacetylase family protein [Metabacillus kandeliae]